MSGLVDPEIMLVSKGKNQPFRYALYNEFQGIFQIVLPEKEVVSGCLQKKDLLTET